MRGIVDQSHSGQPGPLARRLITVHDQEDNHTSSRRGSISRTLQKPEDAFSWSMVGLEGLRSVCIYSPLIRTPANLTTQPTFGGLSRSFLCYGFVCAISSSSLHAVCHYADMRKGIVWHCGSITLAFPTPRTKMDRLLRKKSKKPPKYSQRDIFPGILTNTAVGPLGFRTQLDIAPKGEKNCSYRI